MMPVVFDSGGQLQSLLCTDKIEQDKYACFRLINTIRTTRDILQMGMGAGITA
jgi:hypothetical protein